MFAVFELSAGLLPANLACYCLYSQLRRLSYFKYDLLQVDVIVANDCWKQPWERLPNGSYPIPSGPNLGLLYLRNTQHTHALVRDWQECKVANGSWDQRCFQQVDSRLCMDYMACTASVLCVPGCWQASQGQANASA